MDIARQVGKGDRVRVGQALKDLDYAVLLADEDPPVGRELQHRRVAQPAQHDRVAKSSGQRRRPSRTRAHLSDERGTCYRHCDEQLTPTPEIADTPHTAPRIPIRGRTRPIASRADTSSLPADTTP